MLHCGTDKDSPTTFSNSVPTFGIRRYALAAGAAPFQLLTFEESLQRAEGRKHVLLGNGFSRALRNDIFAYEALFLRADFSHLSPTARQAFTVLNTTDFEVVMRALRLVARIIPLYRNDPDLVRILTQDADGLREVLVQAIAQNHPEGPFDITDEQYGACRRFLANFDTTYTLNYDLLLYWGKRPGLTA